MKRIALFSVTYDPYIGGAEIAIQEVTKRLRAHAFDLFTARMDGSLPEIEERGNLRIIRVGTGNARPDKLLFPFRAAAAARARHKKQPYDCIHAFIATYAGLAALLFKKTYPSVPYILTLQSGDSDFFIWARTWFWYPLYRQVYTRADRMTAISTWLSKRARRYGYKKEIRLIPNGVDIEAFGTRISAGARNAIRATWGAGEDAIAVFSASRLVHKNGMDILIRTLPQLSPNLIIVIAGSGTEEGALKKLSAPYGRKVVFLGHVAHSALPELYQAADIFARPSRTEGMGNVFVEAMASGIPVIGTTVGGIVDIIKHEKTGILVEPNSPTALAHEINRLGRSAALRRELAAHACERLEAFHWDALARSYESLY